MITIQKNKCTGCGTCVSVCPFTVLVMKDASPSLDPEKKCLKCLHCAAACPTGAVCWDDLPAVLPEKPQSHCNTETVADGKALKLLIESRRSYRHYSPEPLSRPLIEEALAVADFAPSAKNQHPTSWVVVTGTDRVAEIMDHILNYVKETGLSPEILTEYEAGNNVVTGTAPVLILGYARQNAINPSVDTALALHTAELWLQSRGAGTCWAGYLTRLANAIPALRELLQLPEGAQFYGALLAGYPQSESYGGIPIRTKPAKTIWI